MKISDYRLGFIGFGHMAKVMFQAIDAGKVVPRSQVLFVQRDTHKMRDNEKRFGITASTLETLAEKSDLLLLAVRPDQAEGVLKRLSEIGVGGKKVITVVTGPQISHYQRILGSQVQILRAMPNLASSVGEGMTVISFSPEASLEFRSVGQIFFKSMGRVIELKESLMDITVGVSGSGPAFALRLIEAMAREGEKGGIPYDKALEMAAQTFLGAARLVLSGQDPGTLVQQIAVPNGTTEAGLLVMREAHVERHFQDAIKAAAGRSRELSNTSSKD